MIDGRPRPGANGNEAFDEVLYEFRSVGAAVRVSAIDPKTNTEVIVIGSPAAGEAALCALARRKLQYVLAKRSRPTT
jgi:alkyl hydroperoxide reductase subunit AhpF